MKLPHYTEIFAAAFRWEIEVGQLSPTITIQESITIRFLSAAGLIDFSE